MVNPVIVPDTGILLSYGFGERIDPKAPLAVELFEQLEDYGIRPVLISSVEIELNKKFLQMENIIHLLRKIANKYPESKTQPIEIKELEIIMSELRREGYNISRFTDAVEEDLFQYFHENPQIPLLAFLAEILGKTHSLLEGIKERINLLDLEKTAISIESITKWKIDSENIGRQDRNHLLICQELGEQKGSDVVFIVFESPIQAYKEEIEKALIRVKVTNPRYLEMYLGNSK